MALVIPSAAEKTLAEFMLGVLTPGNQTLGLYVNNVTPDDATVLATLTEMSTHGYAAKTLTKTSWSVAAGSSGQPATASYAAQTWTFTAAAAVSVYGYFVKDVTTGLLLWAEKFATAKSVENAGDQIIITPKITLSRT